MICLRLFDDLFAIIIPYAFRTHDSSLLPFKRLNALPCPITLSRSITMPVFPTVKADIQFEHYEECAQDEALFRVPDGYSPGTISFRH
jgi:hypothetical protein